MYLVNKEYWACIAEEPVVLRLFYYITHVLYTRSNGRKRIERRIKLIGNYLCQSSLSHPRRPPEYKRRDMSGIYHPTKDSPFANKMFLSDIFIERARSHSLCQRFTHFVMYNLPFTKYHLQATIRAQQIVHCEL